MCTLYINVYVCRKVLNLFVSHCWTFIAGFTAGCKWMLFLRTMYWCCVHTAMWKSLKKKKPAANLYWKEKKHSSFYSLSRLSSITFPCVLYCQRFL
jgi:hypothetical protein